MTPEQVRGDGPLIVTALFGATDQAWLEGLRRKHYPAERNRVPAHCTLFHHLAPALGPELKQRLAGEARDVRAPAAHPGGLIDLGEGVAFRIDSPGLEAIREGLAEAFLPMLIPQDRAGWRPHVTIQNKVEAREARALLAELRAAFTPRPLAIAGLASWSYRDGSWEPFSRHMFA